MCCGNARIRRGPGREALEEFERTDFGKARRTPANEDEQKSVSFEIANALRRIYNLLTFSAQDTAVESTRTALEEREEVPLNVESAAPSLDSPARLRLFLLPAELRLQIYSYIPLPKHGWYEPCICEAHKNIRWLLASRELFADLAPYCNAGGFGAALGYEHARLDSKNILEEFERRVVHSFGGNGKVPSWLVTEAAKVVTDVSISIMLPAPMFRGKKWERNVVSDFLEGIEQFEQLRSLTVNLRRHDWEERKATSWNQRKRGMNAEVEVWRDWEVGMEMVDGKVPNGCVVDIKVAEFVWEGEGDRLLKTLM